MNATETNEDQIPKAHPIADTNALKVSKAAVRARTDKIRSELNIEKWPAIWQPSKSKNKPALRTMEREVSGEDGSGIVSRVEVGYTQLGTLTTEEQKVLYVLIKLWEENGKPDAQVFFSTRALARMLKKKGWGTNVIDAITKSLRKLRTIPIEWVNSYFDKADQGGVLVDRRPFTILGDLRVVERRTDGAVNSSLGYFKFGDHILNNLQLNYTKPVCIEEFFKLKSEIAQLVYTHIDLMLFDKSKYERRSKELFNDLGLKNPEYNHMYERRRALDKALKELEGLRLSSGILRSATIEKTKDGKDYKVSFTKAVLPRIEEVAEVLPELALAPIVVNDYSKKTDPLESEARDLVCYFHQVFHGVESHSPQSKETAQAFSLISQHGTEKARAIIQFARHEAAKTKYPIQHFGAILSYTSRALAIPDRRRIDNGQPAHAVGQPVPQERKTWKRGEARLAVLAQEQYASRFEKCKAELFSEGLPVMQRLKIGSKIYESTIRARVIRALENEAMDLALFDPTVTAKYPWYAKTENLPFQETENSSMGVSSA